MDLTLGYVLPLFYLLLNLTRIIQGDISIGSGSGYSDGTSGVDVFHHYEETVPQFFFKNKKISGTFVKGRHLDDITVLLGAFNRTFTLDLKLNTGLFSRSYIEKSYHSLGTSIHQPPGVTQKGKHCYYHGSIRYVPHSVVAVSTCEGIRGFISDEVDSYHIDPVDSVIHRLFRDSDRKNLKFKCGTDGHETNLLPNRKHLHGRVKREIHGPYDSNQNTRYVELYLVNDYRTFERNDRNVSKVIQRSQDITNIVSRLYRPLNIYVALVGVEVWENIDQVTVAESADTTMENFLRYRRERINPYHRNDNAQLITGIFFKHGVVGKAIKGPICTYQFSGGVNMDYDGLVTLVATTVAHEMGHNFGMEHDNDSTCYCPKEKCIMAATSGLTSPTHWSSCSKSALQEAFELGMDYCLKNKPSEIFHGPVCGNGFVEVGEECDCGLKQDCTNRCCNATSCKLYHQAKCGTGRCCDLNTCQVKNSATLCREPKGECDLPEFCNGTSEYCPADVHQKNGQLCKNDQAYCYNGKCNTRSDQCKLLWGNTGRASDPICFRQLNVRGDQDGNCGYNWTTDTYYPCRREDVMCGLLHCVHLNEKLMFWRDNLAHTMRASFLKRGNTPYVCRSAMLDVGLDMPDPGMVQDGTKCDFNRICVNHKCVPLEKLPIKDCGGCHNNGKCNSNGNCHCDNGYAPPFCDRPGFGGSADSGPASTEYGKANKSLLIGLLVFFLVILPLIGVVVFFGYFYREKFKRWWNMGPRLKYGIPGKKPKPPQPPAKPSAPPQENWPKPPPLRRPQTSVEISDPVLTGSTNRNSQIFIGQSRPHSLSPKQERIISRYDPASSKVVPKLERFGEKSDNIPSKPERTALKPDRPIQKHERLNPSSDHIVKRESFRGSEISSPVLVSTTNRNSEVFPEDPSRIGNFGAQPSGSRSPPPVPAHGKQIVVKRTLSNREVPTRPTSIPPKKDLNSRKSAISTSMRTQRPPPPPRPLPPDLKGQIRDSHIYQNDNMRNAYSDSENRTQGSGNDKLYRNVVLAPKDKVTYSNLASPDEDLDPPPTYKSCVSSLRAKFGSPDSSKEVGRSNFRANDRPSLAPKPSSKPLPKVVKSFNV